MSDQPKRRIGRPPRNDGFVRLSLYVPEAMRAYLDEVQAARNLPDRSAAGRLVIGATQRRKAFLKKQRGQ